MRAWIAVLVVSLLGACGDVQMLGATAAEKRRTMNDMQARTTMAAVCDISLGAYLRELNAVERRYAGLVCGDAQAIQAAALAMIELPEQFRASEPTAWSRPSGRRD
jgi:hypothetical protein